MALKVPIITTVAGATATANAIKGLRNKPLQHVRRLLPIRLASQSTVDSRSEYVARRGQAQRALVASLTELLISWAPGSVFQPLRCCCCWVCRSRSNSTSRSTLRPRQRWQRRWRLPGNRRRWRPSHEAQQSPAWLRLQPAVLRRPAADGREPCAAPGAGSTSTSAWTAMMSSLRLRIVNLGAGGLVLVVPRQRAANTIWLPPAC